MVEQQQWWNSRAAGQGACGKREGECEDMTLLIIFSFLV